MRPRCANLHKDLPQVQQGVRVGFSELGCKLGNQFINSGWNIVHRVSRRRRRHSDRRIASWVATASPKLRPLALSASSSSQFHWLATLRTRNALQGCLLMGDIGCLGDRSDCCRRRRWSARVGHLHPSRRCRCISANHLDLIGFFLRRTCFDAEHDALLIRCVRFGGDRFLSSHASSDLSITAEVLASCSNDFGHGVRNMVNSNPFLSTWVSNGGETPTSLRHRGRPNPTMKHRSQATTYTSFLVIQYCACRWP